MEKQLTYEEIVQQGNLLALASRLEGQLNEYDKAAFEKWKKRVNLEIGKQALSLLKKTYPTYPEDFPVLESLMKTEVQ